MKSAEANEEVSCDVVLNACDEALTSCDAALRLKEIEAEALSMGFNRCEELLGAHKEAISALEKENSWMPYLSIGSLILGILIGIPLHL